ncbi:MAG TPA: alpha/beta hydrolase, partial [Stellaceae bacterium]|nr:alpha/beta hydrolase [Stellaceae bacterium]
MRWLYFALAVPLIGYLVVVGVLYVAQRSLLYHPTGQRPPLGPLAALGVQEVMLHTADGLELFAWYLPPPDRAPVIVYFHGNGGDIGDRGERLRRFSQVGFG